MENMDMKKIYMTPELQVVEMNIKQQIMAGSAQSSGLGDDVDNEEYDGSTPVIW